MFNISFMIGIKRYIGHKSLEEQTLSGQKVCLTFFDSVTYPSDLGHWLSRSRVIFTFLFWVECN